MSLCIYTTASGDYLPYVELFRYCAKRAIPDATVIVDEYDNVPVPYYAACMRLLNTVCGCVNAYITDIDMMLLKTSPTLEQFHVQRMQDTGLCYSNTSRNHEFRGNERLTGLHFASQEWFEKTREARRKYTKMIEASQYGKTRIDDELMLMDIAKQSGLDLPPRHQLTSLHFGIHLGTVRAYRHRSRETMRHQLSARITPEYARQWIEVISEPGFKDVAKDASRESRRVREELMVIESFCRRRAVE